MEAANCPRCGKMFTRIVSPLCPSCEREEELVFQRVRSYIYENEKCTLGELSKAVGVSPRKILRFIREGRLEISKGMHGDVRCELCNRPIPKGRYCDACLIQLNQNLDNMFTGPKSDRKDGARMHISEKRGQN